MSNTRSQRFVGRSVLRREDHRLLTGQGQYIADLALPGMCHIVFVRSPLAHARLRAVDLARTREIPGVLLAMSGIELKQILPPVPDHQVVLPRKWQVEVEHKILNPNQPLLAHDKVRHVGEALAVVVAESRYLAEDAAELAQVDYEPLDPVVDPRRALEAHAPLLHEQYGTNCIAQFTTGTGDVEAALKGAPRRLHRRFRHHRYSGIPMETRGVAAQYDPRTDSITIWSSTQVVQWVRREVAATLRMPEARVRCIALDVGGGFGIKGHVYPEELLIAFIARQLARPVKWIEDRREHMMSAIHARDQDHDTEFGFDDEGRLIALRTDLVMDCGAWNPLGIAPVFNTAVHLPGPYRLENYAVRARIVATNKVPNAPYRGAGRPEAVLVMERVMDLIARECGLGPDEVRRRNMIPAQSMPYRTGLIYRDGEPIVYDSGDYPRALENALAALGGVAAFRERQAAARKEGRFLGLGIACYTEGTGAGPYEAASVRIDPSGMIHVSAGACAQGQGMETIFAQVAADAWSVTPEDVIVSLGDTAAVTMGFGTIASRSTVTVSAAMHDASERVKQKCFAIAGNVLECAPEDLELASGRIAVKGVPARSMSLAELAKAARPGWDHGRPPEIEAGLEASVYYEPPTVTWAYAVHATIVEIDPETGAVRLDAYAIAHDCGVVVNPMLAEGQIMGGAVQGIGGALLEEFHYDANGQLLVGSLLDYALPRADDVPNLQVIHQESPSPLNPLGVKGLGEGGAISPPVAIANAIADALREFGAEFNATPVRPAQILRAMGRLGDQP